MLLLPLILGLVGTHRLTLASWIIPPAAVLLFLARFAAVPGGTHARRGRALPWATGYFLTSVAGLALAVTQTAQPWRNEAVGLAAAVGLLGFANAGLVLARRGRTVSAKVAAMGSAALLAPLDMVVGETDLHGEPAATGLLCFAYFLSSLVTVRTFRAGRTSAGAGSALNLTAHVVLAGVLVVGWLVGGLPLGLLLAFTPVVLRVGAGALRAPRHLRALGFRELAVSVAMVTIAAISLR